MIIRDAEISDIDEVVNVHLKSFDGFFLSLLGRKFLKVLYSSFIEFDGGIVRVAVDDKNGVVGFSAGTLDPESFFSRLRKKRFLQFLVASLPGALKKPMLVIVKLFNALFYKGDKPVLLQKTALLSSIAVLPALAGHSIGKRLLADFEAQVAIFDIKGLYLTTDKIDNDSVVRFYTKAGYSIESEFTQSDGRQMLRLIKLI